MLQCQHPFSHLPRFDLSPPSPFCCFLPTRVGLAAAATRRGQFPQLRTVRPAQLLCLAETGELEGAAAGGGEGAEEGPILLPPRSSSSSLSSIFATTDDPSPLQVSASVLLTGAISVFLFRSLRRRAKRAKEMRIRSSGSTSTDLKEEALQTLKAMSSASIEPRAPPSPVQALLGGIAAGVIALILYKFSTTVEAGLNRQTISDNFSVRQITITIRTIINGLCYLATFIFGINAVGLVLYSGQLAISSLMDPPPGSSPSGKNEGPPTDAEEPAKISGDGGDLGGETTQKRSD
ncbi:unnamed protein product [Spirodela intermedia]|uniref:Uncharacterized protein n=2 Tax=Spirodela intermedia TaxID=51605 RepID=A0A7I8KYY7_SPIIN|nr:unnamed protein product [Spirodela intermedia]CAA6665790.1 unnamed protein product [Spirodela intermedia]CAA7402546.1 unnamed protein product [Spirodela intermedia]